MLIENGIPEAVQFFHIDALSSTGRNEGGFRHATCTLVENTANDQPTTMPWFGNKKLIIRFA
jgi:hypothetical protein